MWRHTIPLSQTYLLLHRFVFVYLFLDLVIFCATFFVNMWEKTAQNRRHIKQIVHIGRMTEPRINPVCKSLLLSAAFAKVLFHTHTTIKKRRAKGGAWNQTPTFVNRCGYMLFRQMNVWEIDSCQVQLMLLKLFLAFGQTNNKNETNRFGQFRNSTYTRTHPFTPA